MKILNKWKSGERSFVHSTLLTRVDHLPFPSLGSGLSLVPTLCFSKAHVFCHVAVGRWLSPWHLCPLVSVAYPTHRFAVASASNGRCRAAVPAHFVEETAISLVMKKDNCSLNHESPSLHTVTFRDDLKLFLVISSLHPLRNVTALFPESTSGPNSCVPPKYCWAFINYISPFVKQGRASWRDSLWATHSFFTWQLQDMGCFYCFF